MRAPASRLLRCCCSRARQGCVDRSRGAFGERKRPAAGTCDSQVALYQRRGLDDPALARESRGVGDGGHPVFVHCSVPLLVKPASGCLVA